MTNVKQLLEQYSKQVTVKPSKDGQYLVVKYKREVFFKDEWDDFLRECRGMILDKDYNIVSLPFTKIHNYGVEKDAPEFVDNELVHTLRKVNGFMVAATWHNGDILWSTTGSVDSMYVDYAKEMFDKMSEEHKRSMKTMLRGAIDFTYMFECVHPNDPHIVAEVPGLYLLAYRYKKLYSMVYPVISTAHGGAVMIAEHEVMTFGKLKELAKTCKHEGFVVYSHDLTRVTKIKSPHYLTKKALMRKNFDKISALDKSMVDEEFYPLIEFFKEFDHERDNFFNVLDEQARRQYIEDWFMKR